MLNRPEYQDARIVVAARNFGCGSSREHAVWSLYDYGIRAVIAPSFGDISRNHSYQNGLTGADDVGFTLGMGAQIEALEKA